MKVLHLLDHSLPEYSGYAFRTINLLHQLRSRGHEVIPLTSPKQKEPEPDVHDGFRFRRSMLQNSALLGIPILGQLFVVLGHWLSARRLMASGDFGLVHAHSPALAGLAGVMLTARSPVPLVYEMRALWEDAATSHGTTSPGGLRYRMSRALESFVLRRADHVVVICEGLRAEVMARGVAPERVSVVANGVVSREEPQAGTCEHVRVDAQSSMTIGYIGSFFEYEGLHLLLQAMPGITDKHPDVQLYLVGHGPEEGRLRHLATQLGIDDNVTFVGSVEHSEVPALYGRLDVCVYPRTRCRLNELVTPLKPLEAMSYGCLVAVSAVGGHRELVEDGVTGLMFEPDAPDAIIEVIRQVAAGDRHGIAVAGQHMVREERNWAKVTLAYEPVYNSLMERSSQPD